MNNFNMMQQQYHYPGMGAQVPMIPVSGMPTSAPAYLPSMNGVQPVYGGYPAAMMQPTMPQMVPHAMRSLNQM